MGFLSSLFGSSKSQPSTQQVVTSQKIAPEIAPAVTKIIAEAEGIYDAEKAAGYVPYAGATIAPFTAEEEAAQAGLAGLVGTQQPFLNEALGIIREQPQAFTPEVAQQFMSPYQRAVTDIEKRESQRDFERTIQPALEAKAIQEGGGMSGLGTRAALEASEAQRNQSRLLADIEARGLQGAFKNAQSAFEKQKAREATTASAIGKVGAETFKSGLAEQGVLQQIGEEKRSLGQSALDEEYFKFLEERDFPQQKLAEYSGLIYGNPLARLSSSSESKTGTPFQPSFGNQLLGIGSSLGSSFIGSNAGGNMFADFLKRNKTGGGISDLVKRKEGGRFPDISGDGKVTQKDILMGRGVIPRQVGGTLRDQRRPGESRRDQAARLRGEEGDGRTMIDAFISGLPTLIPTMEEYKARQRGEDPFKIKEQLTSNKPTQTINPTEMEVDVQQTSGGLSIPKEKTPKEIAKDKADEYRKYGIRSPEDIKRIAQERAQRRLGAVSQDDIPFAAQAASDFLAALGRAAVREEGNVGAAFVEETEKTKKKQAETKKLTKKQELANLEAEFKAEDEAFGVPASLAAKRKAIMDANLGVKKTILELKKLNEEILKLKRGDLGKFDTLVEQDEREETVKNDIEEVIKLSGNEGLMTLFKGLDKNTKNLMARLVAEERSNGTPYQKAIVKVLKEQLAK